MFSVHNPDCLKEMLKEQKEILGDDITVPLDFDAVGKMEYLQNSVKESLRMYPPLIMLMRMAMQDIETTLNGKTYMIPKGDIVITSPAVASRMESVFTKPNDFDPDRFNGPEAKVPYAYLGFGGGMHACMGQQFGLMQVKTIVSILLRNFTIEAVDKEFPEPDYTAMVVGPKNHLTVKYRKITGSSI